MLKGVQNFFPNNTGINITQQSYIWKNFQPPRPQRASNRLQR
jgi:hypothetical protein